MRLDQADRIMLGDREVSRVYLGANLVWRGAFSPASLFAQGEPGVWYDPSDFSTMFQDAAGTVPVTAVEQPVGRILDKSGRGFHATQATATSRPVLRQDGSGKHYLYLDGVDDFLVTPTITPNTDKAQVFAGVRKLSDAAAGVLIELSSNFNTNMGGFLVSVPEGANTRFAAGMSNKGIPYNAAYYTDSGAPLTTVNTVTLDKALSSNEVTAIRKNGADQSLTRQLNGNTTGNFLAYPLYIGRRGGTTAPFNGHLYGLIVRFGPNLPIETIEQTEAWINSKTGAY